MESKSTSARNSSPVFVQGWARIIRQSNRFPTSFARLQRSTPCFIKLDGELLTIHADPDLPSQKAYDIRGATVVYNESSRHTNFSVSIGTRTLYVTCDGHNEMLNWAKSIRRAAVRSFERFYLIGNRQCDDGTDNSTGFLYTAYDIFDARLEYMVKYVQTIDPVSVRAVTRERRVTGLLKHRCLLSANDMFRTSSDAHFVYRKMSGGSALRFQKSRGGRLPESIVQVIAYELFDALFYMHSVKVAHLGVCPNALFLSRDHFPATVALGHLGSAEVFSLKTARINSVFKSIDFDGVLSSAISPYIAPEIARGDSFGPSADLWAAGATIYELLFGEPPFGENGSIKRIARGYPVLREAATNQISQHASSLVLQLLNEAPDKRIVAAAARCHAWFDKQLDRSAWTKRPSQGPLLVRDTPMMRMILSSGLVETKRLDEERFLRFMKSSLVQAQLNIFFPMRRKLVVHSRVLVVCFRLLTCIKNV